VLIAIGILITTFYYLNLKVYDHQLLHTVAIFLNLEEASLKLLNYCSYKYMKQMT
jgi:hypothetical protein